MHSKFNMPLTKNISKIQIYNTLWSSGFFLNNNSAVGSGEGSEQKANYKT